MKYLHCLIVLSFLINLVYIRSIYPKIAEHRITTGGRKKKPLGTKIRTGKIGYISTSINCVFFLCLTLPIYDNSFHIFTGCIGIYCLFKLAFLYPRAYVMVTKDCIHYHNGLWERQIESVDYISTWRTGIKALDDYWIMEVKPHKKHRFYLNILMFSDPKEIWHIINDRVNAG